LQGLLTREVLGRLPDRDDQPSELVAALGVSLGSGQLGVEPPLLSGEESRTYTLRNLTPVRASAARHLLVRPTDAKGADFEIESVRLLADYHSAMAGLEALVGTDLGGGL